MQENNSGAVPLLKRLARYPVSFLRRLRARLLAPATSDISRLTAGLTDVQQTSLPEAFNAVARLERQIASLYEALERRALEAKSAAEAADSKFAALRARNLTLESLVIGSAQDVRADVKGESPAVSIVMATRGRARVIADAIRSVQAQTFPAWELIIVDDGSADHRSPELAPFLDDKRISIHTQPSNGAPAARNRGLELARGDLIAYLDTDCIWFPGFLAAAVDAFNKKPGVAMMYGALVTDAHSLDGTRVLFERFDRGSLLRQNFIDLNVLVHRRELIDRYGNFDESLTRLQDWDLVLRYSADEPPLQIPVLAAQYGSHLADRIGATIPTGENFFKIRKKWRAIPQASKALRVLYVVWHYPQLSESYIETEIRCMLRWGVHVELWCETGAAAAYPASVKVHRGALADAIAAARPHLLHLHWVHFGQDEVETFARSNLPMTARSHGFEYNSESLARILAWPWLRRLYLFPHQMPASPDARLRAMNSAFDTQLFRPRTEKDRRLVVRTGAGLASKDLQFVFELAKRAPDFRFVVAAVTCKEAEGYIGRLRSDWKESGTPCELMVDVPREQIAELVAQAGFYLHTLHPPGHPDSTPIGMPISIAEAMATGAHILMRDLPELTGYAGAAGTPYGSLEDVAEALIRSTQKTENEWRRMFITSVDRAFGWHADEDVFSPLINDWCEIAGLHEVTAGCGSGIGTG